MRIWMLSDLHLDTARGWDLPVPSERPDFDVMVVAGDIMPGAARSVRWLADRLEQPVVFVAGNHERYGRDLDREIEKARQAAAGTSVVVLENESVLIGGAMFFGATGWTDFDLFGTPDLSMAAAAEGLNDYRTIRTKNYAQRLRPQDTLARHWETRTFLERALRQGMGNIPRVVVTHHPLHSVGGRSLPARYGATSDALAPAYMSHCEHLFGLGVDVAISGHTHVSVDAMSGTTRLLSNPKGYGPWRTGGRWENPHFDVNFTFDI